MNKPSYVVECTHLSKTYQEDKLYTPVLSDINLQVQAGEQIAIIGASGSGKSTLLHILGGLDKPTQGQVLIEQCNIHQLSETRRCQFRNHNLGFVYQLHHLLPEFTVFENTCIPLLMTKLPKKQLEERAKSILEKVGLAHRMQHKIGEISGGERQRAAIARALVTQPRCVFADEPTGNLDNKTAESVYELMLSLNKTYNTSFIIVTHDLRLAKKMDKIYELVNGVLTHATHI